MCRWHADVWSHRVIIPHIQSIHPNIVTQCHGHHWLIHISFVPCQSALPFMRRDYVKLWPWKFKVKAMGMFKEQGHILSPVSNWSASLFCFSSHINPTNNSWKTAFSKFDLEDSGSMSWVRSKVEVIQLTQYPTKFLLISAIAVTLGQGHREVMQYIFLPHLYFLKINTNLCHNSFNNDDEKQVPAMEQIMCENKNLVHIIT